MAAGALIPAAQANSVAQNIPHPHPGGEGQGPQGYGFHRPAFLQGNAAAALLQPLVDQGHAAAATNRQQGGDLVWGQAIASGSRQHDLQQIIELGQQAPLHQQGV